MRLRPFQPTGCGPFLLSLATVLTLAHLCLAIPASGVIIEFLVPTASSTPSDITAGPDGNLWFTEVSAIRIGRITPAGDVAEFPVPTAGGGPLAITAGPDGNLWFTVTEFDNQIHRMTIVDPISFVSFPIPPPSSQPGGITTGPDGNLWFTEVAGNMISRITPGGAIDRFALPSAGSEPTGIAAGPDGNLWFTEAGASQIGRITPAGVITEFPIPTPDSRPAGIAAGSDGNLWFTEFNANRIGRITPAGVVTEFPLPTPNSQPSRITAGPDGNLWFTELTGNQIGRITPAGVITEFPLPTPNSGPMGIAVGSDGNLWVVESVGNRIAKVFFVDVPNSHPAQLWIKALAAAAVTGGCAPLLYCPESSVTREQMAVFLLKAKEGAGFTPPPCTVAIFVDVPCGGQFAPWIYELARRGITVGCAVDRYCPSAPVTREQMAVFLLATAGDGPIPCAGTFLDVNCASPFAGWIQRLVQRGITIGCGLDSYCPMGHVTRTQMAIFLVITFDLPL